MSNDNADTTAPKPIRFTALGVVAILAGLASIIFPLASAIAIKIIIGWALLFMGVGYFMSAFSAEKKSGKRMSIILGILFVVVGGWMAFNLFDGVIGLTVLLAVSFAVQGVVEISDAWERRPGLGWGWLMVSGFISLLAGLLIFNGLPSTAIWAIGLMVGINLISSGVYLLAMGGVVRQLTK